MTQEALSPTPERLRRSHWDTPEVDQKTNRKAFRELSVIAYLLQRKDIEPEHAQAAYKFQRHMLGALGIDVRNGDGSPDSECEYPRTYHAQMLAKARDELTPREFMIVERLCQDESTPVSVGFGLSGYARADAARPYGVSAINSALDRLSYFWSFKRREPPSR